MATRRMMSQKVVDTDLFLDMPKDSRLLYYDLIIRADDDGFVSNPKKIMRMIGSSEDDLKILITKKFVIPFQSGVCVIKHWRIHNLIRSDRYTETEYKDEKRMLKLVDNKYFLLGMDENVIPNDNQLEPQVRLGKVRLGKDREEREPHKAIKYLTNIPQLDLKEFTERFIATEKEVISKGEDLKLYCERKGRSYKNYKSFLLNALKKDFKERAAKDSKYSNI